MGIIIWSTSDKKAHSLMGYVLLISRTDYRSTMSTNMSLIRKDDKRAFGVGGTRVATIYSTSMYGLRVLLRIHCNLTNTEGDDMFFFF